MVLIEEIDGIDLESLVVRPTSRLLSFCMERVRTAKARVLEMVEGAFMLALLLLPAKAPAEAGKPTLLWTDDDHKLALSWIDNLKASASTVDDCIAAGSFSNVDAVPDVCNGAYVGGNGMLSNSDLSMFLRRSCAKWRDSSMLVANKRDCEEVGKQYWHLHEALDRASVTNSVRAQRDKAVALGDLTMDYVAKVNPSEVSGHARLLRGLNSDLERPTPKLATVFLIGGFSENLPGWLLSHCPTELAWGLPPKMYATAATACGELEPELRRLDQNIMKVLADAPESPANPKAPAK
jgi:hypothetical protein